MSSPSYLLLLGRIRHLQQKLSLSLSFVTFVSLALTSILIQFESLYHKFFFLFFLIPPRILISPLPFIHFSSVLLCLNSQEKNGAVSSILWYFLWIYLWAKRVSVLLWGRRSGSYLHSVVTAPLGFITLTKKNKSPSSSLSFSTSSKQPLLPPKRLAWSPRI